MQAWIIDHYDTGHICNNCANGAAGILFAIILFVFPITLSLLTIKEAPVFGAYIYCLLLLSLSGYVITINRRSCHQPMRPRMRRRWHPETETRSCHPARSKRRH